MSKRKKRKAERSSSIESSFVDALRQSCFPAEFRIDVPAFGPNANVQQLEPAPLAHAARKPAAAELPLSDDLFAELGTCLWYVKTKHFKRDWDNDDPDDDDPRTRRTLGRLYKGITALEKSGIEISDPTNKRYPQGGENMMRPLQFLPTAGLKFEMVTDTVLPIIYRDERLIQRGEVFVAVPEQAGVPESPSGDADLSANNTKPFRHTTAAAAPTDTKPNNAKDKN